MAENRQVQETTELRSAVVAISVNRHSSFQSKAANTLLVHHYRKLFFQSLIIVH